jgi:chemotaxis protein methyltransferase CheR
VGAESVQQLEIRLLLEAIHDHYGYDFRNYAADSVARRVVAAMHRIGAKNLGELLHRTLSDESVFRTLLSQLTVQVTEFFRDPAFFAAFRREVVPMLRTYPEIKIWHAGCAGGQELYSCSIVLMEEDLYERTQFYGTDIDQLAVDEARRGIYPESCLDQFALNYVAAGGKRAALDYVVSGYDHVPMAPRLRSNLVFFQHDLSCDYALGEMTVIFCRNVAIYFNDALKERVFSMLGQGLRPGGFLCLGSSEAIPPSLRARFDEFVAKERIWRSVDPT